jgi:hypothetical protein
LGRWKHPDQVESVEDILADPSSIPYSAEVNKALTPAREILWNILTSPDKECLEILEEEMFENTDRTGVSGNEQWGLDIGHHQGGWNPYIDAPKLWNGKKREGNEGELEVRLTRN